MKKKISQREAVRNRKELRLLQCKLADVSSAYPNAIKIATVSLSNCPEIKGKLLASRMLGRFLVAVPQIDGDVFFYAAVK